MEVTPKAIPIPENLNLVSQFQLPWKIALREEFRIRAFHYQHDPTIELELFQFNDSRATLKPLEPFFGQY